MTDPDDLPPEVFEAAELAYFAPEGPTKVALWEAAVARADAARLPAEVRMGFRAELVEAAASDGVKQYDRAFGPWATLLAEADRDPEADWVDWFDLLWKYKWLSDSTGEYAAIPRARILAVLDDFAARAAAHGFSARPAENYRANNLWLMGDSDAAAEAMRRFEAADRDDLSDCHACETARAVQFAVHVGDDAGAVRRFQPLAAGRMACAEEPENTHGVLLAPLVRLGRHEEAAERNRIGLEGLRRFPHFVARAAEHLDYLTRTGDLTTGARVFRRFTRAVPAVSDHDRWRFLGAAETFLEAVAAKSDRPKRFALPDGFPVPDAGGPVKPSELVPQFKAAADAIEARFNARNGNDVFTRRRAEARAFAEGAG
ncbi:hypothetical protein [Alienimonas californiensis]|uniref:DUF4034 domain-containing protein n=1 Tax=Alienimonas californiensis TaxID=2527989 RepID=A0A517PFJ5_9PLAN|nr:hypothetical protein [Alienimonas californiensis]QDT18153.1 hypothetical protein CA12_42940 [Alienimonas californiensis]